MSAFANTDSPHVSPQSYANKELFLANMSKLVRMRKDEDGKVACPFCFQW